MQNVLNDWFQCEFSCLLCICVITCVLYCKYISFTYISYCMNQTKQFVIGARFTDNGMNSFCSTPESFRKQNLWKKGEWLKLRYRFCFACLHGQVSFDIFLSWTSVSPDISMKTKGEVSSQCRLLCITDGHKKIRQALQNYYKRRQWIPFFMEMTDMCVIPLVHQPFRKV